ncbi:lipopolysaccharide export system protein LptC [Ferrimonas sediminum]|uniref:Lipopolysaccharide export system protein LptC n=1 Tax=Ferrimonas sediminum TaxID=718193 RepID=A0A1G8KBU4_9GAMM|nr:LPS export ABC transporter periplasmic protein LptC [Ferrimonas sediminum]SDI40898.1 lipopolysaccharide export system protein LptC [Ferrimonas sediminum]
MKREALAIALLFGAASFLTWRSMVLKDQLTDEVKPSYQPDFIAENLKSRIYSEQGHLNAEIAADEMEHYQSLALTRLTKPEYLLYPQDSQGQWRIQAKRGQLSDGRHVVLENDVIITAIEPNEPLKTLTTSYLELDLETMIMTSNRQILATGEDFEINAKGLWADLNLNKVELKSQVYAIYETN